MRKRVLWIISVAVAMLLGSNLNAQDPHAQDIAGDWQGTLNRGRGLRIVMHIAKSDRGLSAIFYSIDQSADGFPINSITLQDSTLKYSIDALHGSYEGKLSADGASIKGTWNQNDQPSPLDFQRATKETAWPLPDPDWGHKPVKVDAKIFDGYVGRYQLAPGIAVNIAREGDHLYIEAPGQRRFELFPVSEKEYFARIVRAEFSFNTDNHGVATGIVVHQGGHDTLARRIVVNTLASVNARSPEIDSMVAAEYAKHPIGSVTIGVVFGKELIWTKSYGNADMEKKIPADKDTVYRIGSITKMFTALMLEQLAEAGKVHLSDPVEKYFPEVKTVQGRFPDAPPITLIQLATHTSGMDREPDETDKFVQGTVADWEKTLIAALPHTRYAYEPGTRFFYSNIGFATLGAALARASGQPYSDYLPKHIFEPLGMTHTALELTPAVLPHLSKGYDVAPSGKVDAGTAQREHESGRGYKVPNGAIYSTMGDLARFCSFLLGQGPDSVLKATTLEKDLTQSAVQADLQLSEGYTLGGFVFRRDTYTAFGHGGAVAGYRADLYVNRDANVAVIVLASAIGPGAVDTNDLAMKSLDLLSK
ncbi:MAG TPA: serine hydrolase [Alphaproteobacteria bacterium]|nr:serine hydrolase [Alphaproteobacteria bacterium]